MKKLKKIIYWTIDYAYMANGWRMMYQYRKPPKHYLGHTISGKSPVILIQGVTLKWGFMKKLGDSISLTGHPVYIAPELGHNLGSVPAQSKIIEKIIIDNSLDEVVIVAHSKGGLIAKHLLNHSSVSPRIKKVIAIATPFHGSTLTKYLIGKPFKELRPKSETILNLSSKCDLDSKICTITPTFDNHVWHPRKSRLPTALINQTSAVRGHHKILFDSETIKAVLNLI